jgi:hypothetical protein
VVFGSLPVGYNTVVKFWPDFYCIEQDYPTVLFADPRRGHGLTKLARSFVFSTMYHHIARGDFDNAQFKIVVYPVDEDDSRSIRLFHMSEHELVDVEALNVAIQETYEVWFEILEEREKEARKTAPTGTGGFFG